MSAHAHPPELKKHLREIEEGNARDVEWMADGWNTDGLVRLCGIVASHARSAGEAAWRQDRGLTRMHLGHTRSALILALKAFNAATAPPDQKERA